MRYEEIVFAETAVGKVERNRGFVLFSGRRLSGGIGWSRRSDFEESMDSHQYI